VKGVWKGFPRSFKSEFTKDVLFSWASEYRAIKEARDDPIRDGLIIGKAGGRFGRENFLNGLVLIGVGEQRYIAPYLADCESKLGFIDSEVSLQTSADSLSELGLESAINNIRYNERVAVTDRIRFTRDLIIGYFAYDLWRLGSGESASFTGMGISIGITFLADNLHHTKSRYNEGYRELAEKIK